MFLFSQNSQSSLSKHDAVKIYSAGSELDPWRTGRLNASGSLSLPPALVINFPTPGRRTCFGFADPEGARSVTGICEMIASNGMPMLLEPLERLADLTFGSRMCNHGRDINSFAVASCSEPTAARFLRERGGTSAGTPLNTRFGTPQSYHPSLIRAAATSWKR